MRNLVLAGLSGILLVVLFSMDRALPKGQNEEKQLERVIRVETLLKDTLEKITETNARIHEDSVKLHEALHAQFEVMKQGLFDNVKAFCDTATQNISRAVKVMNSTATERSFSYIDKVESFIDAATKKITATLKIMNSTITSPIEGKSVLHQEMVQVRRTDVPYSADTGQKRYTYGINETIVFEDVMLNEGGGYDPNTGHFKAPEAGLYMFSLQYYSSDENQDSFNIVHEGKELPKSMNGRTGCLRLQAFSMLAFGDKVWVLSPSGVNVVNYALLCMHSFSVIIVRL